MVEIAQGVDDMVYRFDLTNTLIVGVDPSFTAAGVCVIDTGRRSIYLDSFALGRTIPKDFVSVSKAADEHVSSILDGFNPGPSRESRVELIRTAEGGVAVVESQDAVVDRYKVLNYIVTVEMPSAFGYSILPLSVLGSVLRTSIVERFGSSLRFLGYTPVTLPKTLLGLKKSDKKVSVEFVESVIYRLRTDHHWYMFYSKITDDMAEAFMHAVRGFVYYTSDDAVRRRLDKYTLGFLSALQSIDICDVFFKDTKVHVMR